MRICVLIPTYNEARSIPELVAQIRKQDLEVVVVDDGSTDNTCQAARDSGAVVLNNPSNEGKGASLIRGFQYVSGRGFDAVITMDGDGQHLPKDIPYFIRTAEYSTSGVIIGNRMNDVKDMPWIRILTNQFMSWFISLVTRQKIPDTQCGFRLIKREVLAKLDLVTSRYEIESEILIKAARLGFKIESVPIKTVYLGEKSRIHPFKDGFRFIIFMGKELCGRSRRRDN